MTDGPAAPTPGAYFGAGKRKAVVARSWIRRHKALSALGALLTVLAVVAGGFLYVINSQFDDIQKVSISSLDEAKRPSDDAGKDLNILILGADNGPGPSIAEDVAAGVWEPGSHRSDTIMVLHISANREKATIASIPRDSYVQIYDDHGDPTTKDKINAAFANYGPTGAIATVEQLTGLRMDHLAIIDWKGFKDLSEALGGVEIYIPETFYDESQKITWEEGTHNLSGETALQYVRTRYGLAEGDFDRIERQQNFLRAMMEKLMSNGTTTNPFKLNSVVKAIASNLTVDDTWENGDIRSLALGLRDMNSDQVTFVTAPLARYDTTDEGASIVVLDQEKSARLWKALDNNRVGAYVQANKDDTLSDPDEVN